MADSDSSRGDEARTYAKAGEIFDALCDAEGAARSVALERWRAAEPEAARLAERMLERDGTQGSLAFLEDARSSAVQDEHDPAGVLGATLGAYRIERLLGRGGMGAVYLGRRSDPDARVALKFVTLSAVPAAALERFHREALLLARIDHPGVVRYRDSGVDAHGRPYLAMDLIDGEPLSAAVPELGRDVQACVRLVVALAEAVHHLHQRGVLHRDLKPSNVLLRRDARGLRPVVIDLGIARALADAQGHQGACESADSITGPLGFGPLGTPAFMSPEQARTGTHPDVRTDVHALGAILYALLTGHPPRGLDQIPSSDPLEFHRRLQESEARPPSQVVDADVFGASLARERRRVVDRDLDAVLLKAVAQDPEERYGSAEALASDLQRWLQGLPVEAHRIGRLGRLRRLVRRRPAESVLVLGLGALLAAGTVAIVGSRAAQVRARVRYEEQLAISRELNRFFTEGLLQRAMPELEGPQMPVIDLLRAASEKVGHEELPPVVAVSIGATLMEVFERLGASDEADAELERISDVALELDPDDRYRLLFELQRAVLLTRRSEWSAAEQGFLSVLRRLEGAGAPELEARAANGLGHVLLSVGRLDEAQPWLERALELFEGELAETRGGQRDGIWEVWGNLAILRWSRGELEGTVAALEELLSVFEAQFGERSPFGLGILSNLASVELDRLRPEKALVHARRSVDIADAVFEADHPDRLSALNQLASCLSFLGDFDEAIALRREVYAGRLERLGPNNSAVGVALNNLASTLARAGRHAEGREAAERGLDVLLGTLGDANPATASAYLTLAVIEQALGEGEGARALFVDAIEVYEAAEGDHSAAIEEARVHLESLETPGR